MEGDAGASRLSPIDADESSASEVTPENSPEFEGGADQTSPEVTPEDSATSGAAELCLDEGVSAESVVAARGPSRLGRGWLVGITAGLVLLAGGVGAGGALALRFHQQSEAIARKDAAAIKAAEDCVAATQAPDTAAMAAAARKIIECSTGDFGAQAALYSGLLADAYQAANVHVQVSDMRAAVERNNNDGSINVLVALRTKVSNTEVQGQEQGYRLRVKMELADGQYKISKLDQVAK
jgi:Mce-associated membrane protein